ncbi:MAG: hypothetical protein KY469_16540 [Actinobacteria bacterium]|nr:hypothetical protein [Actinomycetota bacterium]
MVNALYVASVAVVAVLVLALAAYLLTILYLLRSTRDTLGKVLFGVRAIAHRAEPIGPVLADANRELGTVRDAFNDAFPDEQPAAPERRPFLNPELRP